MCLSEGSSVLALPCPEVSPVAGGCSGSGSADVGARAVLRCSSALFPQPSSLLLSFGQEVPWLLFPAQLLSDCRRALCLCRHLDTLSRAVPLPFPLSRPLPARPHAGRTEEQEEPMWRGSAARPGRDLCRVGGSSCRAELTPGPQPGHSLSNPSRCWGQV